MVRHVHISCAGLGRILTLQKMNALSPAVTATVDLLSFTSYSYKHMHYFEPNLSAYKILLYCKYVCSR